MKLCTVLTQCRFVLHVENLNYLVAKKTLYEPYSSLREAGICLCKQNLSIERGGALSPWHGEKSWQAYLYLVGELIFPSLVLIEAQVVHMNWLLFRHR